MPRSIHIAWKTCITLSSLLGVVLFALGIFPDNLIKSLGNHLARDGNLEMLTHQRISSVQPWLWTFGGLFIILGVMGVFRPKPSLMLFARVTAWMKFVMRRICTDHLAFWHDARSLLPGGLDAAILAIILIPAFLTRLALLTSPMQYDEAVTFVDFASRSLWSVISDYSLPNNHIFHTLLVHGAYRLFGDAPWSVRLPALIAGILVIPATFLLGRSLYNRYTGWLAAALVGWWPIMVSYSTNARGYTLLGLFTTLIFLLGKYVLQKPNCIAWAWIAVLAALGLYTVPVMLYPVGILYTWLLIAFLFRESRPAYPGLRFICWLVATGLGALSLTGVLYLPVLVVSGFEKLFGNSFVQSQTMDDWLGKLPAWAGDIWFRFTLQIPWPIIAILMLGLALALLFHRRIATHRSPSPAAAVLFFGIILPIQRPEMLSKIFLFILPLLAVWSAAGIVGLIGFIPMRRKRIQMIPCLALVMVALVGMVIETLPNLPYLGGVSGENENVVLWLRDQIRKGDVVLVDFPIDGQVMYYAHRYELDLKQFRKYKERIISRALVLVNPTQEQSLESVIERHPLENDPLNRASCRQATVVGSVVVYECLPARLLPCCSAQTTASK